MVIIKESALLLNTCLSVFITHFKSVGFIKSLGMKRPESTIKLQNSTIVKALHNKKCDMLCTKLSIP